MEVRGTGMIYLKCWKKEKETVNQESQNQQNYISKMKEKYTPR